MLSIQEENPKDINKIYEINQRAFGEEIEAKIVNALREADELILSLIAKVNNLTIGHIAFSEVKINSGEKNIKQSRSAQWLFYRSINERDMGRN